MLVKSVFIEKFRGFKDQSFTLGNQVTLIAGQNGTQKSTLLGILTQTFTIPPKEHIFQMKSHYQAAHIVPALKINLNYRQN